MKGDGEGILWFTSPKNLLKVNGSWFSPAMHYRFCPLFAHFGTLSDTLTYSIMLFDDLLKTCLIPFTVEMEDQMILIVKEFSKNEKLISPISIILQPLHNG